MPDIEIHVQGSLDAEWSDWFGGLTIQQIFPEETVLRGSVLDKSAIYGVLSRLSGLGLSLLSVQCQYNDDKTG